jgi:hypothetical protein
LIWQRQEVAVFANQGKPLFMENARGQGGVRRPISKGERCHVAFSGTWRAVGETPTGEGRPPVVLGLVPGAWYRWWVGT